MERRLAAKWFIQRGFIGWQCRRAADAPRIAGFAKVSGCRIRNMLVEAKLLPDNAEFEIIDVINAVDKLIPEADE